MYFGGQGILIGSETPQRIDPAGYARVYQSVLRMARSDDTKAGAFMEALMSSRLLDADAVDRAIAAGPVINTDWNR